VSVQVDDRPLIMRHRGDAVVAPKSPATLMVEAAGADLTFQRYQGISGDTSHSMSSSPDSTFPSRRRSSRH